VVELACLENKCASNGTEGSNPSLSAISKNTLGDVYVGKYFKPNTRVDNLIAIVTQ
jgi:hypothetical protein